MKTAAAPTAAIGGAVTVPAAAAAAAAAAATTAAVVVVAGAAADASIRTGATAAPTDLIQVMVHADLSRPDYILLNKDVEGASTEQQ